MYETIIQEKSRTLKEIDEYHTMICIEDVEAITIKDFEFDYTLNKYAVMFWINGIGYESDEFDTKEGALKFRDKIMGWETEDRKIDE